MVENSWMSLLLSSIAIVVGIVSIILWKKKLTCKLFPFLSLVDVRTEVKDKIKIYYNENSVENLSMMKVKVRNTGYRPIREEDIKKPIEFNFGEKLNLIDHSVTNRTSKDITVNLKSNSEKNLIRCSFNSLEPGEEFTLQFVCLGESKKLPDINARIVGIKRIDVETMSFSEEMNERMRKQGKYNAALGLIISLFGAMAFAFTHDRSLIVLIAFGILSFMFGFIYMYKHK